MEATEVRATLESGWPELAEVRREHDADPVSGGLDYLEMAAIARLLAAKLRTGHTEQFGPFFDAVERCLLEGTIVAVTLVTIGLLEDLQNSNITEVPSDAWSPFLQPTTRRAWQSVEDFWNGDVLAIKRFSLDLKGDR